MPTDSFAKTRILITGGSGFIGTNLLQHYAALGPERLLNLDQNAPRNPAHRQFWDRTDIMDVATLRRQFERFNPTHVFHLAARADMDGTSLQDYDANIGGVTNTIEAVRACKNIARVIFASSRMVCRIGYQPSHELDYCPSTVYGQSKVETERLIYQARNNMPPWLIVRPTSIWGPWFDIPYRQFFDSVSRRLYVHPRGRVIRKSFGYVGNTVFQLDSLMFGAETSRVQGKMFYLCDSPPIELPDFANQVSHAFGQQQVLAAPYTLLKSAALAGDFLKILGWLNPPLTSFRLDNLLTEMLHDSNALEEICGRAPYNLAEGISATVAWMRTSGAKPDRGVSSMHTR